MGTAFFVLLECQKVLVLQRISPKQLAPLKLLIILSIIEIICRFVSLYVCEIFKLKVLEIKYEMEHSLKNAFKPWINRIDAGGPIDYQQKHDRK